MSDIENTKPTNELVPEAKPFPGITSLKANSRVTEYWKDAKINRKKLFTQKEIAGHLEVSEMTIIRFEKGEYFDFNLFDQYCSITGTEYHLSNTDYNA